MLDLPVIYLFILLLGGSSLAGLLIAGTVFTWVTERLIKRSFGFYMVSVLLCSLAMFLTLAMKDQQLIELNWNSFIKITVNLHVSLVLLVANVLLSIVGNFSSYYLHRESGYKRYFFYYLLFFLGINLALVSSSIHLFILGWEWIGLSSVMLIAFFHERAGPIRQARYVFVVYRIGDFLLLLGATLLMLQQHDPIFPAIGDPLPSLTGATARFSLWCFAGAALIKGAQFPFTAYLVRAMEGPTASSAAFYGALSVHMGPLLLLRFSTWVQGEQLLTAVLIVFGAVTVLTAMLSGRVRSDVKGQLAYASAGHLGLIFIEIGLGWNQMAYLHILGHMGLRTLHFLSAPSFLQLKSRWTLHHIKTKNFVVGSDHWLQKVYWQALAGFDALEVLRFRLIDPILRMSRWIDDFEWRAQSYFSGTKSRAE